MIYRYWPLLFLLSLLGCSRSPELANSFVAFQTLRYEACNGMTNTFLIQEYGYDSILVFLEERENRHHQPRWEQPQVVISRVLVVLTLQATLSGRTIQ